MFALNDKLYSKMLQNFSSGVKAKCFSGNVSFIAWKAIQNDQFMKDKQNLCAQKGVEGLC